MNRTGKMNRNVSGPRKERQDHDAFTFAELLIVIATTALLALTLLPALASSRSDSKLYQCLINQKRLAKAVVLYAQDHNDALVPFAPAGGFWNPVIYGITAPWNNPGISQHKALALVQLALASTNNPLYPYASSAKVYHCPSDMRLQNIPGQGWAYDSYSKTQNITGTASGNYCGAGACYTNLSQIKDASATFVFIEDADDRGYNNGCWAVEWDLTNSMQPFQWLDVPVLYHGIIDTAAYTDGHAEPHRWSDPAIIYDGNTLSKSGTLGGASATYPPSPKTSGRDYEYIHNGYRFPGWQ